MSIREAPSKSWDRHGIGGRRRSDRRRLGAGTIGRRRDAQPRRPAASPSRAGRGRHRRGHAPAARRSLRIPRSRGRRGQGHRHAGVGLAGAAPKCRREPVRGAARIGADPAGRPRRGNRPAIAPMGARQSGRRSGRAGLGRGWSRQVAHHRGIGGAAPCRTASPPALFLLALSPGQRAVPLYRPARPGIRVHARRSAAGQAGEARGPAGPRRAAGGGCGIPRRSAVVAGFGAPPPCPTSVRSGRRKGFWRR